MALISASEARGLMPPTPPAEECINSLIEEAAREGLLSVVVDRSLAEEFAVQLIINDYRLEDVLGPGGQESTKISW